MTCIAVFDMEFSKQGPSLTRPAVPIRLSNRRKLCEGTRTLSIAVPPGEAVWPREWWSTGGGLEGGCPPMG